MLHLFKKSPLYYIGAVGGSRPLVLPNPFSGDQNWTEWIGHFEDVAAVNEWRDDDAKLQWLKARLTGKAQTAFQRFPEEKLRRP